MDLCQISISCLYTRSSCRICLASYLLVYFLRCFSIYAHILQHARNVRVILSQITGSLNTTSTCYLWTLAISKKFLEWIQMKRSIHIFILHLLAWGQQFTLHLCGRLQNDLKTLDFNRWRIYHIWEFLRNLSIQSITYGCFASMRPVLI